MNRSPAKPTINELFNGLLNRAGLTYAGLAKQAGYSSASGLQRWALEGATPMPARVIRKIMPYLEGRGDPPIVRADIFALGDPEDLLVTASELELLLCLRSREYPDTVIQGLLGFARGGGVMERPPDKQRPTAYAPAQVETERVGTRRRQGGAG